MARRTGPDPMMHLAVPPMATVALLLPLLMVGLPACTAPPAAPPPPAENAEARRLHTLFEEAWEDSMRRHPEWATYLGDKRYGDQLEDASPEAEAAVFAAQRRQLAAAQAVRRDALSVTDRTSLDIFLHGVQDDLRFEPLVGYRRMSMGALFGFQGELAALLDASPVATKGDVEQMLSRLAAYPKRVDQELVRLRQGMALGWVPPRVVLDRVLATLDRQLAAGGDSSPFLKPFTQLGEAMPKPEQETLRDRARRAVAEHVLPAQRRLRDFVAGDYLAAAPASGALAGYPGGAAVYAAKVRSQTTSDLSAAQIHAIGLREVARLHGEFNQVMQEMKWPGDLPSFVKALNSDPAYFVESPEALLVRYRDIAKRLDAELPRLFAELPRITYGVKAMPSYAALEASEYYEGPALDGSRPGWFMANAASFRTRATWQLETMVAHEAVPGHHLQVARAVELGDLPPFRRSIRFTAYDEGWALYAETLGFELGLYKDPASRFGHLQNQMLRAARLVVDTGIHAQGWSRQQAIDYLRDQTQFDPAYVESEIDRYISDPGQALGYMIGMLKIQALRDQARATLGERFDIRRFHMVLIDQGAVPLAVLERLVDDWVQAESTRAGAPRR
jgi:uncharacterized protein (DUF885 family)